MLREFCAKNDIDQEIEQTRDDNRLDARKLLRLDTLCAASEALGYRIAKPVTNKTCPTCNWCGAPVPRHCPNCGQALELRA
jgi:hypothetical protein